MRVIFDEGRKIIEPGSLYNDPWRTLIFGLPNLIYSFPISVKFSVSITLYFKSIDNLGTEIHQKYKDRLENGLDVGCFALTELGHGSNVRQILTTAHYDSKTEEFIINTPEDLGMKFWIGGAAKTATISVVFAQLIIDGESQGPHVFIVPLRDRRNHDPLPGIIIGDCGKKIGNDGIDNGFLIFKNFRIPRENLLNRFSNVTKDGKFQSNIENADKRFAVQLGSLSQGRLMIVGTSPKILGYGLKIALRFAAMRRQFGKPGEKDEQPLIEYPLHQYRLFPYVANTIAFTLASNRAYEMQYETLPELFDPESKKVPELHAVTSALKGIHSWAAYKGLQECREACGGLGYSYYAKLGILRDNFDVNQTWEGDNSVLLQQAAKYIIDIGRDIFKGKAITAQTVQWIKRAPVQGDQNDARNEQELFRPENLVAIFTHRCNLQLQKSGLKLQSMLAQDKNLNQLEAWNNSQVFYLKELSIAFGELFIVQQFFNLINSLDNGEARTNKDTKECLILLYQLHCATRIEVDLGTFREGDYLSSDHGDMIRSSIVRLCGELKRHIIPLVETFYPGDEMMDSFLAPGNGDLYGSIINKVYSAPNAFGKIKNWQVIYQKSV